MTVACGWWMKRDSRTRWWRPRNVDWFVFHIVQYRSKGSDGINWWNDVTCLKASEQK
jgi:hypothetical protein